MDVRSDVYSLGAVAYEMLTGAVPFSADTLGGLLAKQLTEEPTPVTERNPTVGRAMNDIVLRCLEKEPAARFQSMDELADALKHNVLVRDDADAMSELAETTKLPAFSQTPALSVELAGAIYKTGTSGRAGKQTTLRSGVGEVGAPSAQTRGGLSKQLVALATGGAIVALLVGLLVGSYVLGESDKSDGSERSAIEAPETEDDDGRAPDAEDEDDSEDPDLETPRSSPEETAAPEPATVVLRIESRPTGATITDDVSGEELGTTPHELEIPVAAPRPRLVLTLPGFKPKLVSPPTDRPDTFAVELKRIRKAARKPPHKPRAIID